MHPMLNIGIRAARAAGNVIARKIDRIDSVKIDRKQRSDFVTDVDQEAESEIIGILKKAFPDHSVLGEESGQLGATDSDFRWIIDPLDGTSNFIHGVPHMCVSIALEHKGRLDQAVIYDPLRQELFTASRGEGAWLDNKRLRVSKSSVMDATLLGHNHPYRPGVDLKFHLAFLQHVTESAGAIRRTGSAALDLAYLAAGRMDGVWAFGMQPWDIAAGALIVREAGGLINDADGSDKWMQSGNVIAGNPKVQDMLMRGYRDIKKANAT